jgi:hypothetical protein
MYARFFNKQKGLTLQEEIFDNPDFSFNEEMPGDKMALYCDGWRFLFLYYTDDKEERRLVKVNSDVDREKLSRKIYKDLEKAGYNVVGLMSQDTMDSAGHTKKIESLMDNVEKEHGVSPYKTPNPYFGQDEEVLKKQYFSLANHELPEMLALGFVKAMEKIKKKNSKQKIELCCVVDTENSCLVFAYGDECEDKEDDNVFYTHKCKEPFTKCADMVEAISTLNIGQESSHWLTDAIALAQQQEAFLNINVEILGSYMYGEYDMDVIYSSM